MCRVVCPVLTVGPVGQKKHVEHLMTFKAIKDLFFFVLENLFVLVIRHDSVLSPLNIRCHSGETWP